MSPANFFANPFRIWRDSISELRKVRVLALCGLMCALAIVLGSVASINIGQYIRIGFSGLPNRIVDFLFGPAIGAIFGGILDILKYIIKPSGAFFPGFTLSAMLGGAIYGCFFYQKKVSIIRVFLAQLTVKVFVNVFLNTLWLNMLYGKGFLAILPGRIVSNAVMLPIDTVITFFLLKFVETTLAKEFRTNR